MAASQTSSPQRDWLHVASRSRRHAFAEHPEKSAAIFSELSIRVMRGLGLRIRVFGSAAIGWAKKRASTSVHTRILNRERRAHLGVPTARARRANRVASWFDDLGLAARACFSASIRAMSWSYRQVRRIPPVAAIIAVIALPPLTYLAYCLLTLPDEDFVEPSASALVVQAGAGQIFATRGVFKGEKLAPGDLPRNLEDAIVAIEDRHFFSHHGFYPPSLLRAAVHNALAGSMREGGSTISQQLARMLYLSPERTFKRKIQEAILALRLEYKYTKEEILTRYLNIAYFGARVYGADAAAKRYFGKPAQQLSLAEAAMLAGLVRAPSALAPTRNLDGARQRAALVLDAMVDTGAISAADAEAAREHPAALRLPPDNPPGTNYSSTRCRRR